jgi:large subunit ribosomal protein L17
MRHRKDGRQFGRNTPHRRAMFRNLAANLVTHERIVTTEAKAKELRRVAEKLITKAKRLGPIAHTPHADLDERGRARRLHVARLIGSFLPRWGVERQGNKRDLIEKVMIELSQRFAERPGGYTRIVKIGPRRGDGAPMSVIEFVDAPPPDALPEEPEEAAEAAPEPVAEPEEPKKKAKVKAKKDDAGESASDDEEAAPKKQARAKKAEELDDKPAKKEAKASSKGAKKTAKKSKPEAKPAKKSSRKKGDD